LNKTEVRELARSLGVPVAAKPDSQEICFVPNGDYSSFIDAYFREQGGTRPDTRGEVVDSDGHVVAEHAGVHNFTVGQRKRLGVARGEPLYVIATEPETHRVIVGRNDDLLRPGLNARAVNWVSIAPPDEPVCADVKIRNKHTAAPATIYPGADSSQVQVRFDEPQRAITPGQAAVFYSRDVVLGGGWID
jgi:tRNA-specific 2-thiouridylase